MPSRGGSEPESPAPQIAYSTPSWSAANEKSARPVFMSGRMPSPSSGEYTSTVVTVVKLSYPPPAAMIRRWSATTPRKRRGVGSATPESRASLTIGSYTSIGARFRSPSQPPTA